MTESDMNVALLMTALIIIPLFVKEGLGEITKGEIKNINIL
jgi:hypothetical protein